MFTQITDGEAAVGMPPFGPASSNPIDETGRWNLVAAVYSLATPPENVEAGRAVYEIVVENPDHLERGVAAVTLDGKPVAGLEIPLDEEEGGRHRVVVRMGA